MPMRVERILSSREARANAIYNIVAITIAVIFLFPIYWLVMMSFKSDAEIFSPVLTYFPRDFTIEPWLLNIRDKEFFMSLRNSCIIATIVYVPVHAYWHSGCLRDGEVQSTWTEDHVAGLLGFTNAATIADAHSHVSNIQQDGAIGYFLGTGSSHILRLNSVYRNYSSVVFQQHSAVIR